MTARWACKPLIGAGVVVLALLGGCGGHALAPPGPSSPPSAGSPAAGGGSLGQGVFAVIMRPQQPMKFPDKGISWLAPSQVLKLLPPAREPSADGGGWLKSGGGYDDALPKANIAREGDASQLCRFSPQWNPGDPISKLAYGVYRWNLRGFSGSPTVKLTWDSTAQPSDYSQLFIGLADVSRDTWQWYSGPADGVLTVPSFGPYRDAASTMLMMVVMLGDQQVVLQSMEAGAPETRGTGAEPFDPGSVPTYPPLGGGGFLPKSVDLSPGCAPINDQLSWHSCTAFAVGDGAYNYELNRIYGAFGWDLSKPAFRVSPKYLYVVSGEVDGDLLPESYGRKIPLVLACLMDRGVATDLHAPYDLVYLDEFNHASLLDAQVLKSDSWQEVMCNNTEGLATVKVILALQEKPVVLQMDLDASFLTYQAGQVWRPQGSQAVMGHVMCIVGYDDAKGAFKVRNSWGADWGESGYAWIAYDALLSSCTGSVAFTLSDDYSPAVASRFQLRTGGWQPVYGVSASDGTVSEGIQLSWNQDVHATSYVVYRDHRNNRVHTVFGGATTSWLDGTITDGYGHVYWVQATDGVHFGPLSSPEVGYAAHVPEVFSVEPAAGEKSAIVTFSASGYGSGNPLYAWDFGGGAMPNTSLDEHPLVALGSPGTYSASVVVTNGLGSDTYDFTLTVTGVKPRIQYIGHRSGFAGDVVTLKPHTSGPVDAYTWDFGGGATPNISTAEQPTVTLGAAGLYESSLRMTSAWGSDTYNFYLAVVDPRETDWTVPGHDACGSGQSPAQGPQTNNVKWKRFVGLPGGVPDNNHLSNVLAFSDGDIIVSVSCASRGGMLKRLSPDGTAQWSKVLDTAAFCGQPTLGERSGFLYYAEDNGVVALDPASGGEKWRYARPGAWRTIPLAEGASGELYAIDTGRYLCSLDSHDGSLVLHPVELADRLNAVSAALLAPSGTIFAGSRYGDDCKLVAFDTSTDALVGSVIVPSRVVGLALSADGTTLYATDEAGDTCAYDTQTCRQLWWQTLTRGAGSSNVNPPRVMADGTVVVASQSGLTCALDPETGATIWSYDLALGNGCRSVPAIGRDGTIYFGGSDGMVHAVRCGSLIWESPAASTLYFGGGASIGPDGTLYCGDDDGWLWAFGPGG